LAPTAPGGRAPQRGHQVARLRAETLVAVVERAHLLGERRVGVLAGPLDRVEAVLHLGERLSERRDEVLDGLAPLVEVARGAGLRDGEAFLREREELARALPESVGRERLELDLQPFVGALEERELLGRGLPLTGQVVPEDSG